ncbi:MAG: hypothetical protein MUP47_07125 [Phycisphaerae bacterium]|nr:hypothetical protein [Phycisphaerae bacterium]
MPSKYPMFDRRRLRILPLSDRQHLVDSSSVLNVGDRPEPFEHADLPALAEAILQARRRGAAVVMLMGAHVIKQGLSRYLIDFLRRGWLSALAGNGACAIHDYELARIGATSESVSRYIATGQFGLWKESAEINDIVTAAARAGLGFGEALGQAIAESRWPHREISVYAAAWQAGVPATVHVGVGYDIIHEHPNFDAAAAGTTSDRDFLILTKVVEGLEGGVVLCVGSAVMGPEVYLKALAMARNVAGQQGRQIRHITSAVLDLVELTGAQTGGRRADLHTEAPKDSPEYYFRPYKTMLVRTVADGGRSFYIRGDHRATIPALHALLEAGDKR